MIELKALFFNQNGVSSAEFLCLALVALGLMTLYLDEVAAG